MSIDLQEIYKPGDLVEFVTDIFDIDTGKLRVHSGARAEVSGMINPEYLQVKLKSTGEHFSTYFMTVRKLWPSQEYNVGDLVETHKPVYDMVSHKILIPCGTKGKVQEINAPEWLKVEWFDRDAGDGNSVHVSEVKKTKDNELWFDSSEKAIQHLADITGKPVKVAGTEDKKARMIYGVLQLPKVFRREWHGGFSWDRSRETAELFQNTPDDNYVKSLFTQGDHKFWNTQGRFFDIVVYAHEDEREDSNLKVRVYVGFETTYFGDNRSISDVSKTFDIKDHNFKNDVNKFVYEEIKNMDKLTKNINLWRDFVDRTGKIYFKKAAVKEEKYIPPKGAQEAAKKVLEWKEKYPDEVKAMTRTGWTRARQLAEGVPLSLDIVKRMAQFNRHRKNKTIKPEYKGTPWKDRGYVAWLGWGGDVGVDWAMRISERESKKKTASKEEAVKKLIFNNVPVIKTFKEYQDNHWEAYDKTFVNDVTKPIFDMFNKVPDSHPVKEKYIKTKDYFWKSDDTKFQIWFSFKIVSSNLYLAYILVELPSVTDWDLTAKKLDMKNPNFIKELQSFGKEGYEKIARWLTNIKMWDQDHD